MIDYREDNKWTVYVHIVPKELSGYNWNKYYVGITSRDPKRRWGYNGNGYKNNNYFHKAINKYGWDNINHEIIASKLTKDEACNLEITLIKVLESNDNIHGYNITNGGQGILGLKRTEATKEKIRKANYGKKLSSESIEKIRIGNLGKKLSKETLERRSAYFKNTAPENISITKTVYQFTKDGIFIAKYFSIKSASEYTNISAQKISYTSNHYNCSACGFLWIKDDNIIQENGVYKIKNFLYNKSHTSGSYREVYQFDINTNKFISKYSSYAEASRCSGESINLIRDDARYKRTNISTKKKFRWRYKEDVKESELYSDSFVMLR